MATVTIPYQSSVYIPVAPGCCSEVILCLDASWAEKTVSGSQLVVATIQNSGRRLYGEDDPIRNVRCVKVYQYTLKIDLTQFEREEAPTCADINEIMPYSCTVQSILSIIQQGSTLTRVCLEGLAELPDPAGYSQGCIISVIDDGLYYHTGTDWIKWGDYQV